MYVGAFLRQPSAETPDPVSSSRDQSAASAVPDLQQLYEVGTLAKVENMVKHESINGAQLLLYGHTRIKRLDKVRSDPDLGHAVTCCILSWSAESQCTSCPATRFGTCWQTSAGHRVIHSFESCQQSGQQFGRPVF